MQSVSLIQWHGGCDWCNKYLFFPKTMEPSSTEGGAEEKLIKNHPSPVSAGVKKNTLHSDHFDYFVSSRYCGLLSHFCSTAFIKAFYRHKTQRSEQQIKQLTCNSLKGWILTDKVTCVPWYLWDLCVLSCGCWESVSNSWLFEWPSSSAVCSCCSKQEGPLRGGQLSQWVPQRSPAGL